MSTFFRCPLCGNDEKDYRVYRCPSCGKIMCGRCAPYNYCPCCNGPLTWKDQIGYIG